MTRRDGRCVVVTNGADHMRSLRSLVETAVRVSTPGWEMRNPSTHVFSLENGEGVRFLVRSRLFSDDEFAQLKAAGRV